MKYIKKDLFENWQKYSIYAVVILLFIMDGYFSIKNSEINNPTVTDYFVYIFAGTKEYIPNLTELFRIPFSWLIIYSIPIVFVSKILSNNFSGYGQQLFCRIGNRTKWWINKWLHINLFVIKFYCISFIEIFIFSIIFEFDMSTKCSEEISTLIDCGEKVLPSLNVNLLLESTLLPLLFTLSLAQVQSLLSLWIKPTYAITISIIILFTSVYYLNPFIIGNYSMPIRSNKVVSNGVDDINGIILFIIVIIITLIIGNIKIKKYDIIKKDEKE